MDCGCSSLGRNTFIVTIEIGYLGFMRENGGRGIDVINSRIKVSDEGNNKIRMIRSGRRYLKRQGFWSMVIEGEQILQSFGPPYRKLKSPSQKQNTQQPNNQHQSKHVQIVREVATRGAVCPFLYADVAQ